MRASQSAPFSALPAALFGMLPRVALVACFITGCAARPSVVERPVSTVPPDLSGAVIVIDAGHPSENGHGATSPRGTVESQITLAVARKVETMLKERDITVVMTRTQQDQVVTNRERAEIANRARAQALIRLHCDARAASGTATYYPDRRGTVDGVTGPSAEVISRSERLANIFHSRLIIAMGPDWGDVGVFGDSKTAVGERQGALTGSIFSEVPAITVEMVSLANARDDAFITTEEGQLRMARGIVAGIEAYLRSPAAGFE